MPTLCKSRSSNHPKHQFFFYSYFLFSHAITFCILRFDRWLILHTNLYYVAFTLIYKNFVRLSSVGSLDRCLQTGSADVSLSAMRRLKDWKMGLKERTMSNHLIYYYSFCIVTSLLQLIFIYTVVLINSYSIVFSSIYSLFTNSYPLLHRVALVVLIL